MVGVYENSGLTGTTYKQADAKHPRTGYYLTEQELRQKNDEIEDATHTANETKRKAQAEISKAKERASLQVKEAKEEAERSIEKVREDAQKKIYELMARIEHEQSLNENLKRVATERANKARHMDKHDEGYLILNWQPFHYKRTVRDGKNTEVQEFDFYKMSIQTPWDCSLPESIIDKLVMEAILEGKLRLSTKTEFTWYKKNLTLDMGIDYMDEGEKKPLILNRQYRSNVKEGLWEVTLITDFEPSVAAKHRKKYP